MNASRRGFLGALFGGAAAIIAAPEDPEQLLWRPGAKLISIPNTIARPVVPVIVAPAEAIEIVKEMPDAFKNPLAFKYRVNSDRKVEYSLTFGLTREQILSLSHSSGHDRLLRYR